MLKSTLADVRRSIVRFHKTFAEERGAYPHLARFADPVAALNALAPTSSTPQEERYVLIAEIVASYQRTAHPVWSSLLLAAFTPMLLRLRKRLRMPADEGRDSHVVLAFLYALKTIRIEAVYAYAAVAIERATKKAAFAERRKVPVDLEAVVFDEESCSPCDPYAIPLAEARAELAWTARRAARALADRRRRPQRVRRLPARRSAAA